MDHPVTIKGIGAGRLVLRQSFWSAAKLVLDGEVAERTDKRNSYVIAGDKGEVKIDVRQGFMGMNPALIVEGMRIRVVAALEWYQWAWAGLPLLLIVPRLAGGAVGVVLGLLSFTVNAGLFRREQIPAPLRYAAALGVTIGAFLAYVLIGVAIESLL